MNFAETTLWTIVTTVYDNESPSRYVDAQGDLYTFGSPNYARLGHSGDGKTPLKVPAPREKKF